MYSQYQGTLESKMLRLYECIYNYLVNNLVQNNHIHNNDLIYQKLIKLILNISHSLKFTKWVGL
jgi:hypothetical protein